VSCCSVLSDGVTIILSVAVIYIEAQWSWTDLMHAASNRLELVPVAKRLFNANGMCMSDG
jgi:hypothetical protein